MKRLLFVIAMCFLSIINTWANTKAHEIPLAGNAYEIGHSGRRSTVHQSGAKISATDKKTTAVYFKVLSKGNIQVRLKGSTSAEAKLKVKFLGKEKTVKFSSSSQVANLGSFIVKEPGYLTLELSSIIGDVDISHVEATGEATKAGMLYVNSPDYYYWGRRGPSCHLNYEIPTNKDVSYYYNEVFVPEGEDVLASYFMANGFGEGYFGMQVNSPTERRVLFSVWSPFHTDDPKSIPDDEKIVLLKKGEGVQTGEFGNEGSGGQSFFRYNWKAGQRYKFLLKGVPDGKGNTDYTAWFFIPEDNNWKLIASFKRPKTNTYLRRFHSFLENFSPTQGYLSRKVEFANQWVYDGQWKAVTGAKLSVDATYNAKQREDATGGSTKEGYFLKMGGFFNEIEKPGTVFHVENKNQAPQIDFSKLP